MKNALREKLPGSLLENIRSHLKKRKKLFTASCVPL